MRINKSRAQSVLLILDTPSLLIAVSIVAASIQEREGAKQLL